MKAALALLISTALLVGCNTIQGVGRDVSQAGNAVATGAQKVKSVLP